ncbi:MAG TPA: AarF/ABC1/UbiB kinase family protein [Candidatus Hydrogenedentes bacterium]|nr:AarF/ABC1/UbiB kinase family protein [Candidatus Hydrogenedentota bacterium]HQL93657.1 AarF/ABC1/UbiB kinase family protein [Candidatus Hydrogenedentota bacterium]HRZ82937.1 AarF/ABC1/UbiB kinase family protein [Candidatus Hydrogenedentota bacterium]
MMYTRLGRNTVNAVRLAEIMQVLVRHGFADLLNRAGFYNGLPARLLQGLNLMNAPEGEAATLGQRLREALAELGPTFVKMGQILSTRPDLVGASISQELVSLQDRVSPIPWEIMSLRIEDALNVPLDEVFASISHDAVASASLSQVYRAVLRTGEQVAVKVQRPDIEKTIESDLSLMRSAAEWIADHLEETRLFDPVGIVDEFARSIRRELDFTIEAMVVEQFGRNFADDERVVIPRVHRQYSSRRLLMLEWVDGVRADSLDDYPKRNSDPKTVAVQGCEILCRMVFEHRLFHADPHPGNIFLVGDNRIAFLDLGMAGHLEESDIVLIADLFHAIFRGDSRACMEAVLQLTTQGDPDRPEALQHELAEFIAFEAPAIISGGQALRGLEATVQIMRRHNLEPAPRFSLLIKGLATIEVVGRSLYPDLDMLPILQPYLQKLVLARYSPSSLLAQAQAQAGSLARLGRQAPEDITVLLRQLRRGKLKFQIHHEHLENLSNTIDRSSKRNAVAMVIAALVVGSSLLVTTNSSMVHLGIAGYLVAGALGFMLVISILWGKGI